MTTIKDICTEYHLRQTELADRFDIPLRTVQDWHSGRRTPPDYVVKMMLEILERDSRE
jgi:DNA-binding transcriptional regulator YiaG